MKKGIRVMAVLTVLLAVGAGLIHAAGTPAQKCAAAKNKAAAKKISSKLNCQQKAIRAGAGVDMGCLLAAEMKFSTAITKAESAGGCAVTGDRGTIESACDACVSSINALTPVTTTTTTTTPPCTGDCAACGSCGHGECALPGGSNCGRQLAAGAVCLDASTCTITFCATDADCPTGTFCLRTPGTTECCAQCP